MFKSNKTILIALLIIAAFVGYRYMFKKDNPNNSDLVAETGQGQNGQSAVGKDLMITISKLKSLTLDETFFNDPIFKSLNDFSVPIIPQEVGRSNPFSPIGAGGSSNPNNDLSR